MGLLQFFYNMIMIPFYLLKQEIGIVNLQKSNFIDFNTLVQKLIDDGMNVNLNQRVKYNKIIHEAHIGDATLPGQIYLVQKGPSNYVYIEVWGSLEFREKIKILHIIEKINEDIAIQPFLGLTELKVNLFSITNMLLKYYLGMWTTLFGYDFMRRFHSYRHPATGAFWVSSE